MVERNFSSSKVKYSECSSDAHTRLHENDVERQACENSVMAEHHRTVEPRDLLAIQAVIVGRRNHDVYSFLQEGVSPLN